MKEIEGNFKELLDNLYDGVYCVDSRRRIIYWNKAAEQITGFQSAEVLGKHCHQNILRHMDEAGTELCEGACPLAKTIVDALPREAEVYLHHKDGHRVPVSVRITPIRDDQGRVIGAVQLFADNSSKAEMLARLDELEQLSLLDPLTKLGNRRFIEMNLRSRWDEMNRYGFSFGVIFLDIDHFKSINDRYGHDVGDNVLKMVAGALASNSRPFDVFGRWGGEEFVGILRSPDTKGLCAIAERLRTLIRSSFLIYAADRLRVTVSLGATMARQGDTPEELLRRADRLMFQSKTAGRDRVSTDEPDVSC
jgi:diguanylate cyclase (GGDEF)-like protein/PAS domain S-box-containing protein